MIKKEFNIYQNQPVVLIAPLDWGLGHTTRCIPLIKELEAAGCKVLVAATESIKKIIETECPSTVILRCKGYGIRYSKEKKWFALKLLSQVPALLMAIIQEHHWLKKIIHEHSIDAVISDNRLGLYNKKIVSVYITHQLRIKAKYVFIESFLQRVHYFFIRKYDQCWVPDQAGNPSLSGALSHPVHSTKNVLYIGPLSRFEKAAPVEKTIDLLVILSGPEPQRTLFENLMIKELKDFKGKACLVRAKPLDITTPDSHANNVKFINHLDAVSLKQLILTSTMVISRCGYTTVMDLVQLKQPAILIPTPGQTEQEYLSEHLHHEDLFYTVSEKEFSLATAMEKASTFPFRTIELNTKAYKNALAGLVEIIHSRQSNKQLPA